MVSQLDVVRYLVAHEAELGASAGRGVQELGLLEGKGPLVALGPHTPTLLAFEQLARAGAAVVGPGRVQWGAAAGVAGRRVVVVVGAAWEGEAAGGGKGRWLRQRQGLGLRDACEWPPPPEHSPLPPLPHASAGPPTPHPPAPSSRQTQASPAPPSSRVTGS